MSRFFGRVLILSGLACIVPVLCCESAAGRGFGGGPVPSSAQEAHFVFDVSSIRENLKPDGSDIYNDPRSSLFIANAITLNRLLQVAYHIQRQGQLTAVPEWAENTHYNITAKSDAETDRVLSKMNQDDVYAEKRQMLQVLLAERFHLKIHQTTKQAMVYELVATPRTATLMPAVQGDGRTVSSCSHHLDRRKGFIVDSKGCPFTVLFSNISQELDTDVVDHTGMSGMYAYRLMYRAVGMPKTEGEELYPDMVDAVREQLGLELRKTKGAVTTWVVDSIERPTAN